MLGQSRSWILGLLTYEDEVYAAVSLLLEHHSLSTMHATFAESLYGLKRQPAAGQSSSHSSQSPIPGGLQLSRKQQYQALACQVGVGFDRCLGCSRSLVVSTALAHVPTH